MDKKFIRTVSPLTFFAVLFFDVCAAAMCVISVKKLLCESGFYTVGFVIISIITACVAVVTTVQILKNGVRFDEEGAEFTGVDKNNVFLYSDIASISSHKDTATSLKKNTVDRYSSLIFEMKDGTVATVELGLTTKRTLAKIEKEIKKRIGK